MKKRSLISRGEETRKGLSGDIRALRNRAQKENQPGADAERAKREALEETWGEAKDEGRNQKEVLGRELKDREGSPLQTVWEEFQEIRVDWAWKEKTNA